MTKTKHALLMSGLALLLCVSMLVGSTYAWFTDSVTSSGNIIKSGTLDVTMEWKDGKSDPATTTAWTDASTGAIFNYDKWEPGYVEVRHVKIENVGTLALKYQISITANGEVSELSDVIDVYYADPAVAVTGRKMNGLTRLGTLTEVLAGMATSASGNLAANTNHTVTLALKMQESAGNEYQNKSIGTDFSVVLMATQNTVENDSFDNLYDDDADRISNISVKAARDMQKAFDDAKDGDVITLADEIIPEETLVFDSDAEITLDLGGQTIESSLQTLIKVNSGKVTIQNGTIINNAGIGLYNLSNAEYRDAIHLSGDAVVEIKDVVIETIGNAIVLEDNARITELNAKVTAYCDRPTRFEANAILLRSGSARIDLISGGEYTSAFTQEQIDAYASGHVCTPFSTIHITGTDASIGEISGGTFIGTTVEAGTAIRLDAGKIEKISGGYFGFCKNTMKNDPWSIIATFGTSSIDAITGGTFEHRIRCQGFDFEGTVAASGCTIEKTPEQLEVTVKFTSSTKKYMVDIWKVIA